MKDDSNGTALQDLDDFVEAWNQTLPKSFTIGTSKGSRHRYPALHFTADDTVPELYHADLDPQAMSNGNRNHGVSANVVDDSEGKIRICA